MFWKNYHCAKNISRWLMFCALGQGLFSPSNGKSSCHWLVHNAPHFHAPVKSFGLGHHACKNMEILNTFLFRSIIFSPSRTCFKRRLFHHNKLNSPFCLHWSGSSVLKQNYLHNRNNIIDESTEHHFYTYQTRCIVQTVV